MKDQFLTPHVTQTMVTLRESLNIPDIGPRSFTIEIQIPESEQIVPDETRIIIDALREFVESGGEVGDIMIGQEWIVEFSLLREVVISRDSSGTEYCKTYLLAVLRNMLDEVGTDCRAVYRIVIDFYRQRVLIQDVSILVGLRQRTPLDKIATE